MRLEFVVLIVVLAAFVMAVLILVLLAPARERGHSADAPPPVDSAASPWSISRLAGDRFALRNESSARAFDVKLSGADELLHVRMDSAIGMLAPGQQQPFVARCPIGVADDRVLVTWRRSDSQEGELMWACRLPPAVAP